MPTANAVRTRGSEGFGAVQRRETSLRCPGSWDMQRVWPVGTVGRRQEPGFQTLPSERGQDNRPVCLQALGPIQWTATPVCPVPAEWHDPHAACPLMSQACPGWWLQGGPGLACWDRQTRGTGEDAGLTRPVLLWLLGPCGEGPGSVPTAYPGSGALSFHVTHQALS